MNDAEHQIGPIDGDAGSQLVGTLSRYPGLLAELGADPEAVFTRAGLEVSAVTDPHASIPFVAFGRLLTAGVEMTGCDHLGLLIGQRARLSYLGPVGQLMQNAPTIGDALTDLVRHQRRYIRGSAVYAITEGPSMLLGYTVHQPGAPGVALIWDAVVAAAVCYLHELSGRPLEVEALLPRSRPEAPEAWHRALGDTVRFGSEHAAIVLPETILRQPVVGADPDKRRHLEEWIRVYSITRWPSFAGQLSREIRVFIMTGQPVTRGACAAAFGVSERTLNRQLEAENTHFNHVLADTRREMAIQMLDGTRVSLGEIALALGYSEHSAFSRAFKSWTGISAEEWRRTHASAPSLRRSS
jgi:AraC-like DNA-binding protein